MVSCMNDAVHSHREPPAGPLLRLDAEETACIRIALWWCLFGVVIGAVILSMVARPNAASGVRMAQGRVSQVFEA